MDTVFRTSAELAIARFLRIISAAALELAHELEAPPSQRDTPHLDLDDAGLGSLQLAVGHVLAGTDPRAGTSPREIANTLGRVDEPNIRGALNRLSDRGVAERVPDLPTQRWRLTARYRSAQSVTVPPAAEHDGR